MVLRWFDYLRHQARLGRWHRPHALGRRAEDLAHRYVRARGFVVVARNWRTRSGSAEVDIIAWDGPKLVFIEVKSRETAEFGDPDQAVDSEKRTSMRRAALEYLRRTDLNPDVARFDIISVLGGERRSLVHYADAFSILQRA